MEESISNPVDRSLIESSENISVDENKPNPLELVHFVLVGYVIAGILLAVYSHFA